MCDRIALAARPICLVFVKPVNIPVSEPQTLLAFSPHPVTCHEIKGHFMASFFQNWPVVRTARSAPHSVQRRAVVVGSGVSLIFPLFVAMITGAFAWFFGMLGFAELSDFLVQFNVLMGLSLIGIIPSIFVAAPVAIIAIKTGYAGWACALSAGAIVAYLFSENVMEFEPEGVALCVGFGLFYSALFWLTARLSTPAAFIARDRAKDGA